MILLLLKNFVFRENYASYDKMSVGKVVCLKNIYKFSIQHFLVRRIVFDLNIKSDIEKFKKAMLSNKYMSFCKLKIIYFHDSNCRPGENMRQKPLKSLLIMYTLKN